MKQPRTQSWLLRNLRLKTSSVKETINFLSKRGLLTEIDPKNDNTSYYQTTHKGRDALLDYYDLITKYFEI